MEYWYCDICGKYFSDAGAASEIQLADTVTEAKGHGATELKNVKEATCTEEGYTGDKVCKDCGTVLEKGKVIPKTAHNYKNGKCTVCGTVDPNYKADTGSPQTGDNNLSNLWVILMAAAALVIVWAGARFYGRKQEK